MATAGEIVAFRLVIGESDTTVYSDAELTSRLDAGTALGYTYAYPALKIWEEKAARYSALVNISEGGSSRSNATLFDNALKMVNLYREIVAAEKALLVPVDPGNFVIVSRLTR